MELELGVEYVLNTEKNTYFFRTAKSTRTKPVFWPYKPVEMRTKIRTFSVPDHIGEIGHFGSIWANFPNKLTFGRKISVFWGFWWKFPICPNYSMKIVKISTVLAENIDIYG